jgi:anti-sigma regulatory factor (Ser/Thr protein kinase)
MEALTPALLHQNALVVVSDETGVGEARRVASSLCDAVGFDETRKGRLALVVTEAASNAMHHAGGGEILFRRLREHGREGFEVLAIDKGPGMRSLSQSLEDGHSTRGTSGTGLGSIMRNSDVFDVFTAPDRGTVLLAQVWNGPKVANPPSAQWGVVCVALSGEQVSGDGWVVSSEAQRTSIALFDGLGHGQGAADATLAAIRSFNLNSTRAPGEMLQPMHDALRATRGAAAAFAAIDSGTQQLRFAGVGNCSASIHRGAGIRPSGLASQNGTLGAKLLRVNELSYDFPLEALLIMHTDGLGTRWNLDDYSGLFRRHPSVIAAVLYRDFTRLRDDVTVLAFTSRPA